MDDKFDPSIEQAALVLWSYHDLQTALPHHADIILVMGSHDLRVAEHAADLMLGGLADRLVLSGGSGKATPSGWGQPEALMFRDVALRKGVQPDAIVVEPQATNTGDNVTFSRRLLESMGVPVNTGVIVSKPYMKRRSYATACKQWTEVEWSVSAPESALFDTYGNDVNADQTINLMVGDLQRIRVYADKGYQVAQEIPECVWEAYETLVAEGYDSYVIRD